MVAVVGRRFETQSPSERDAGVVEGTGSRTVGRDLEDGGSFSQPTNSDRSSKLSTERRYWAEDPEPSSPESGAGGHDRTNWETRGDI